MMWLGEQSNEGNYEPLDPWTEEHMSEWVNE